MNVLQWSCKMNTHQPPYDERCGAQTVGQYCERAGGHSEKKTSRTHYEERRRLEVMYQNNGAIRSWTTFAIAHWTRVVIQPVTAWEGCPRRSRSLCVAQRSVREMKTNEYCLWMISPFHSQAYRFADVIGRYSRFIKSIDMYYYELYIIWNSNVAAEQSEKSDEFNMLSNVDPLV